MNYVYQQSPSPPLRTAAVIPAYRCRTQIAAVIERCLQAASGLGHVYVIDDACPEHTGALVSEKFADEISNGRITVHQHARNQGVGGAMATGYGLALKDGCEVVVKIDGDGQMDPLLAPLFIAPIARGDADYTKGNRFFSPRSLQSMPLVRLFGNSVLSLVSKAVTGYWNVMDPNNGFTAIHRSALELIDLSRVDRSYFFETDMLFRLNTVRAVVQDIPMKAVYAGETSSLSVRRILFQFPPRYFKTWIKRLGYMYFVRDFNIGTIQGVMGALLLVFGAVFGGYHWHLSNLTGMPATSGTVMLSAMPIILGFQLLLSALSFDVANVPSVSLQRFQRGV